MGWDVVVFEPGLDAGEAGGLQEGVFPSGLVEGVVGDAFEQGLGVEDRAANEGRLGGEGERRQVERGGDSVVSALKGGQGKVFAERGEQRGIIKERRYRIHTEKNVSAAERLHP